MGIFTAPCGPAAVDQWTALALVQQGIGAEARGDYAGAQKNYETAIESWRALGSGFEPHLGITLANLGHALDEQAKYADAAAVYEEALTIERHSLGSDDIRTVGVMNSLAVVQALLGNPAAARALFEEALPILRERYPADVQLPRTLAGLSGLYVLDGRLEDAGRMAGEALALSLRLEGESGPDAPTLYATAAEAHRAAGRSELALPLYRKAIALLQRQPRSDERAIAQARGQYGWALFLDGKPLEAERELRQALQALTRSCARCYREQWIVECNLGLLKTAQGKLGEAEALLRHVLAVQEAHMERPGIEMAQTLRALAKVLQMQDRNDDAARLAARAAELTRAP